MFNEFVGMIAILDNSINGELSCIYGQRITPPADADENGFLTRILVSSCSMQSAAIVLYLIASV